MGKASSYFPMFFLQGLKYRSKSGLTSAFKVVQSFVHPTDLRFPGLGLRLAHDEATYIDIKNDVACQGMCICANATALACRLMD